MSRKYSEGMRILESKKAEPVYFVKEKDKIFLQGDDKIIELYRKGYNYSPGEIKFESYKGLFEFYDKFVTEKEYSPSVLKLCEAHPNKQSKKPGIEIMASRSLFKKGLVSYYSLMDNAGLDTDNSHFKNKITRNRKKARSKIDRFLKKELYAPLSKSEKAYEKNLVRLINENVRNPENYFDLHLLSEPKARWAEFDEIDLEEALMKNISIDIDWVLANKILAGSAIDISDYSSDSFIKPN